MKQIIDPNNWEDNIPKSDELEKLIEDPNITSVEISRNGNWVIDLYIDEYTNGDTVCTIGLSNIDIMSDKNIAKYGEELMSKFDHLFHLTIRDIPVAQIHYKLKSCVEECKEYLNYINTVINNIF
jgi:hypothetical protein